MSGNARALWRDGRVRAVAAAAGTLVALELLIPPQGRPVPAVDVAAVAARVAPRAGFTPAVPTDLPPGWTPTGARLLEGTGGTPTWRLTYTTDAGHSVGVIQGLRPPRAWENRMVMEARESGVHVADGVTWVQRPRPDRGVVNLVLRGRDVVTIVTGRTDLADLDPLVAGLDLASEGTTL